MQSEKIHALATALRNGREFQSKRIERESCCAWAVQDSDGTTRLLAITHSGNAVPIAEVVYLASAELKEDMMMVARCLARESGRSPREQDKLLREYNEREKRGAQGALTLRGRGEVSGGCRRSTAH